VRLELWVALWAAFAVSIIYIDINMDKMLEEPVLISDCHEADVKLINNKFMCLKCDKYCEVIDGKRR